MYDTYVSNFYDDRYVTLFNLEFNFFKQRLDEMEHPVLITKWTTNTDKAAYKQQSGKKKHKPQEKKPIVTFSRNTRRRYITIFYVVLISGCFEFYNHDLSITT